MALMMTHRISYFEMIDFATRLISILRRGLISVFTAEPEPSQQIEMPKLITLAQ